MSVGECGDYSTRGNVFQRNVANKSSMSKSGDLEDKQTTPDDTLEETQSPYTVQNFAWIIAAIGVVYFTGIIDTILYDDTIYRSWLNVGLLLIAINVCIASFLIGYLSIYRKISADDWDRYYPSAIPVATACAIFGGLCLVIALWPAWSFLTPLLLLVILMGIVISLSMLPAFD